MSKQTAESAGGKKMSRRATRQQRQAAAARQNQIIRGVAVVLVVGLLALLAWQLLGRGDGSETAVTPSTVACPGTLVDSERPLAQLPPAERNGYYDSYPPTILEPGKRYYAHIQTARGDMCLELFDDQAPLAANNFAFLALQGFYDGVTFHRVLADFMAQGGDPTGSGRGGPGYQFANEVGPDLTFDRPGLLAMANAGPDTNGSQFFITFTPQPSLNGGYTIFGELVSGDATLGQISLRDPQFLPPDAAPGDEIRRIDIYAEG